MRYRESVIDIHVTETRERCRKIRRIGLFAAMKTEVLKQQDVAIRQRVDDGRHTVANAVIGKRYRPPSK